MARASKGISDDCSAVAFYGIRPSAQAVEAFYHTMVKWFGELGYPPDKAGVTAPGFGSQIGSFARFNAKLAKTGFRSVTGVNLVATTLRARDWESDYYVTASYMGGDDELTAYVVARSSLATLSATSMLPVARVVAKILKPVYGIGYTRLHELYPDCYAIGLLIDRGELSGDALREEEEIAAWSETLFTDHAYRKGILRDVYRWNFLTRPHLTKKVGSVSLEQWIRQSSRRGKLSEFCKGLSFWEVAEKQIPAVRKTLRRAGLILEPTPDEDEEDTESTFTPEEALAIVIGDQPAEDLIVFDSVGNEIPTEEVKKIIKRGSQKQSAKRRGRR
jgi:hypothetical protein